MTDGRERAPRIDAAVAALERGAHGLDHWLGRHERLLWTILGGAILAYGVPLAVQRPLWFDEIFTLYLGRFESLGSFWASLSSAGDFNPPLHYLAGALFHRLGAGPELAVRLPALLSFAALLVLVYAWIARRLSPLYGWLAVLFLLRHFEFAVEGRPYAPMMALVAAFLVLRERRRDGVGARWELGGLGLCVALGVSTHFYCVPFFGALLLAEAVLSLRAGRWDRPLWIAVAAGLAPLLLYLPIALYFREFSAPGYWSLFRPRAVGGVYAFLGATPAATWLPLLLLSTLHVLRPGWFPERPAQRQGDAWAAALALAVVPLAGALAAYVSSGHYTPRHYLVAGIGIAALATLATWRLGHGSRLAALALILLAVLPAARALGDQRIRARAQRRILEEDVEFLAKRRKKGPITTCNPLWALKIAHYSRDADPPLLVFCDKGDPERSADRSLLELGTRAPLEMLPIQQCLSLGDPPRMVLWAKPRLTCYEPGEGPPREPGGKRPDFTLYRLLPDSDP